MQQGLLDKAIDVKIEQSWKDALQEEFAKEYFHKLVDFVKDERQKHTIFPPGSQYFNAFNLCPFAETKVVILGQDPYHNHGQAHGLCFSVPDNVQLPPSLRNIYKELNSDLGITRTSGNLTSWAKQGVLLLNATLTVRAHQAGSHQGKGWEQFTDKVIETISQKKENIVFILWGGYAKKKIALIDQTKHLVLSSAHPSPLSAHNGFFGNKHFSRCNDYLRQHSIDTIGWS